MQSKAPTGPRHVLRSLWSFGGFVTWFRVSKWTKEPIGHFYIVTVCSKTTQALVNPLELIFWTFFGFSIIFWVKITGKSCRRYQFQKFWHLGHPTAFKSCHGKYNLSALQKKMTLYCTLVLVSFFISTSGTIHAEKQISCLLTKYMQKYTPKLLYSLQQVTPLS